ncbi:transglutaminase TgpA family protein [Undibacterium sp. SXout7W]|uniref:transglutaminase TgpA family protein n=1 Tax=Undibacterium sp. SXout7W TaxID=3413049 RepID=UPI003BF08CA9
MKRLISPVLSRDKADTLLLLTACLLVLIPHAGHVSWWVNIGCAMLLVWRGWLTLNGKRLPPSWILLPVSTIMMGGVYLTHKTFFGKEAGVTMLVLLLTCKLLEMHAKRDLFVVIFLSFFLLLTSFFYQQTIGAAMMTLLALSLLLTAQLSFQYTNLVPSLAQRLKLGASILAMAIPLTIVSFFLFPRIQGPLWGLPGDAQTGRTGLSDSMTPGMIGELALSEDIAFRVKFDQQTPDKSQMYWRGLIMNQFDGRTWTRGKPSSAAKSDSAEFTGTQFHQEIILEPTRQRWLFALDLATAPPLLDSNGKASLNTQMELRNTEVVDQRLRYQVNSAPVYRLEQHLSLMDVSDSLDIPPGYNPRTLTMAAELRQRFRDDQELINQVLQFFRREQFTYTLEPPVLGVNSVDDFLFQSRAGFCEHYASAFVILMRAADIPARVVTGYQGGTKNTVDNQWEIRQSDAHAWAEVWLKGKGWIRVDPTAAVAPERVMQNIGTAIPKRGIAGLMQLALGENTWLKAIHMQWSAINNHWNQWVLNYNQKTQKSLLGSLGIQDIDWAKISLLFFICGATVLSLIALPLMRNKLTFSPLDRVYFSFCKKMAKHTAARAIDEGPHAYMQRLKAVLPAHEYIAAQQFLSLYSAARYGKTTVPESMLVRRLKTLLAQCR